MNSNPSSGGIPLLAGRFNVMTSLSDYLMILKVTLKPWSLTGLLPAHFVSVVKFFIFAAPAGRSLVKS